jgi:hypothetical protein
VKTFSANAFGVTAERQPTKRLDVLHIASRPRTPALIRAIARSRERKSSCTSFRRSSVAYGIGDDGHRSRETLVHAAGETARPLREDPLPMLKTVIFALAAFAAGCGGKANPEDDAGMPGGSSTGGPSSAGSSTGEPSSAGSSASGGSIGSPTFSGGSAPLEDGGFGSSGQGMVPPSAASATPTPGGGTSGPVPCSTGGGVGTGGGTGAGGGGGGGAGSSGAPFCETTGDQTCGGKSYQVTCACPQGTCACFGDTTTVVPFAGCPKCPGPSQAFVICGFSH